MNLLLNNATANTNNKTLKDPEQSNWKAFINPKKKIVLTAITKTDR